MQPVRVREGVVGGIFLSAVTHSDKRRINLILCISEYTVITYLCILIPEKTAEFVTPL